MSTFGDSFKEIFDEEQKKKDARENQQTSDIKPDKHLTRVEEKGTGQLKDQPVTEGGVDIDKSNTTRLYVGGPMGHQCTNYLNRVLSTEGLTSFMGAAYRNGTLSDDGEPAGDQIGYVRHLNDGEYVPIDEAGAGFVYVVDGKALTMEGIHGCLQTALNMRRANPNARIGVCVVNGDQDIQRSSTLTRVMQSANVPVALSDSGINGMVRSMAKKGN